MQNMPGHWPRWEGVGPAPSDPVTWRPGPQALNQIAPTFKDQLARVFAPPARPGESSVRYGDYERHWGLFLATRIEPLELAVFGPGVRP